MAELWDYRLRQAAAAGWTKNSIVLSPFLKLRLVSLLIHEYFRESNTFTECILGQRTQFQPWLT
jgi:hypothetical protein